MIDACQIGAFAPRAVARSAAEYPARLGAISDGPDPIWICGRIPVSARAVALVGARAASGAGLRRARDLAERLAAAGIVVVSGGAVGVDAAAHAGALAASAPTIAVLPAGLDDPYPARHRELFAAIAATGALVSPCAPGTPIRRYQFPNRNRVIAALADAVVVVEAGNASGSLYTAKAARDYGRVLGACPGSPGTAALIGAGAATIESVGDIEDALAGHPRRPAVPIPEAGSDQDLVLAALDQAPRGVEDVGERSGLGAARAARALCALEIDGLALPAPGGRYLRSAAADLRRS
jgi:DNA processing protein